jgi:hypothetical protein
MILIISYGSTVIHTVPDTPSAAGGTLRLPTALLWAASQIAKLAKPMGIEALEFVRIRSDATLECYYIEATNGHVALRAGLSDHTPGDFQEIPELLIHFKVFEKWMSNDAAVLAFNDEGKISTIFLENARLAHEPIPATYAFPTVQAFDNIFPCHYSMNALRPILWDPIYMKVINEIIIKLEAKHPQFAFSSSIMPMEIRSGINSESWEKMKSKTKKPWGDVSLRFIILPVQKRDDFLYWTSEYTNDESAS